MKKVLLSLWVLLLLAGFSTQAADTQLVDQFSGQDFNVNQLKFSQVKSCESLEKMLEKYAREYSRPLYLKALDVKNEVPVESAIVSEQSIANSAVSQDGVLSSSTDFSQTNIQKIWVDEPELIKTDGKYFFYYNQTTHKISIVTSPLDIQKATLDSKKIQLVNEIIVPEMLDGIELFLAKDRLIIIGQMSNYRNSLHESFLTFQNRSIVAIYDTSKIKQLQLLKFENLPGWYQDARLIDDQLYVVSELGFNWRNWKGRVHDFRKGLASVELTSQGTTLQPLECSQISYVLPEDEKLSLDPVFTLVAGIDIRDMFYFDGNLLEDLTDVLLAPIIDIVKVVEEEAVPAIDEFLFVGLPKVVTHVISAVIAIGSSKINLSLIAMDSNLYMFVDTR